MDNLQASIKIFIEHNNLLPEKARVILGLSGGPDSVFLLDFLAQLHQANKISLIAAHLDHQWREESYKDAEFCKKLAEQYNIPFMSKKISKLTLAKKPTGSLEALGRAYRRCFFEAILHETKSDTIALAHHLDDQQETFFIRLIRGATLSGLASMRPKTGTYIRPLLQVTKSEILAYLHASNIPYLIDPTNMSEQFLRNKLRLSVLPALQQADARFANNFLKTIESLQDTENFLEKLTHQTFQEITEPKDAHAINTKKLLALNSYIRNRVIILWLCQAGVPFTPTTRLLDEILRFLHGTKSNTHTFYNAWVIKKTNTYATISFS